MTVSNFTLVDIAKKHNVKLYIKYIIYRDQLKDIPLRKSMNIIINFCCPILILMKRAVKRNYTWMTFMAVLIVFGHWIDFYQMVMGSIRPEKGTLSWLDFGIAALFIGLMIHFVGKALAKKPMVSKYHPFLKESLVHHTI